MNIKDQLKAQELVSYHEMGIKPLPKEIYWILLKVAQGIYK